MHKENSKQLIAIGLVTIMGSVGWLWTASTDVLEPADRQVNVILQGDDLAELTRIVANLGGSVTHELEIISAVGAAVPEDQMLALGQQAGVKRLFSNATLVTDSEDLCRVHGKHVLDINPNDVRWEVINQESSDLELTRIDVEWPSEYGELASVGFGNTDLGVDGSSLVAQNRAVIVPYQTVALEGYEETMLRLKFQHGAAQKDVVQSDFAIRIDFRQGCGTELVAGYEDHEADTYYPTVTDADRLHEAGITGLGVTVAVIDTGFWSAKQLRRDTDNDRRVLAVYDAIADSEDGDVSDLNGHGTHVTSIVANSDQAFTDDWSTSGVTSYKGIAPDADLVVVRAFDEDGRGSYLDVIRGIEYVLDNRDRFGIKVLNLSFGASPQSAYWSDPLNQAVMKAWDAGIVVIASAGNGGPDPLTIGVPGNVPYVITVGAVSDNYTVSDINDDFLTTFSSVGPTHDAFVKPDVLAPGGHMLGLTHRDSALAEDHPEYYDGKDTFIMSGTSQATAIVSGIAALMLQHDPLLTPDDVKCRIMYTAHVATADDGRLIYSPFQQGAGYANAYRAVSSDETGCINAGMDIGLELAGNTHYRGPAYLDEDGNYSLPGLDGFIWSRSDAEQQGFIWSRADLDSSGFIWSRTFAEQAGFIWSRALADANGFIWSRAVAENDGFIWSRSLTASESETSGFIWSRSDLDYEASIAAIDNWVPQE